MTKNLYKTTAAILAILFFKSALPAAINISVSPDAWTVPAGAENPSSPFTITNAGEQVRINARASNTDAWQLSNIGRLNAFAIAWRDAGDWASLSTKDSTMFTSVASGGTQSFTLKYSSPTYTIPNINGNTQTSNITLTAVSGYMGANWNMHAASVSSIWQYNQIKAIALDPVGNPHVAYWDNNTGYLMYADWNGEASTVTASIQLNYQNNSSYYGFESNRVSLTIDKNGTPHILFIDDYLSQGERVFRYARLNGSGVWEVSNITESSFGVITALSIVTDGNNIPHIVYHNEEGQWYAYLSGNTWIVEQTPGSAGFFYGDSISMKLDSNENVHTVYWAGQGNSLEYKKRNKITGEWSESVLNILSEISDARINIAIDSTNRVYLAYAYYDYYNGGNNLSVAKLKDDGQWTSEVAAQGPYDVLGMVFDANGYPNIGCVSGDEGLLYLQWTGVEWLKSVVSSAGTNFDFAGGFGFDVNGRPTVSYVGADRVWNYGSLE